MSMKMTMAEFVGLEPCPFCGGEVELEKSSSGSFTVGCSEWENCIGFWTSCNYFNTEAEAIAAWNSRAERTCQNVDDHKTVWFICSMCGYQQKLSHTRSYCPNCGCKVVGE